MVIVSESSGLTLDSEKKNVLAFSLRSLAKTWKREMRERERDEDLKKKKNEKTGEEDRENESSAERDEGLVKHRQLESLGQSVWVPSTLDTLRCALSVAFSSAVRLQCGRSARGEKTNLFTPLAKQLIITHRAFGAILRSTLGQYLYSIYGCACACFVCVLKINERSVDGPVRRNSSQCSRLILLRELPDRGWSCARTRADTA